MADIEDEARASYPQRQGQVDHGGGQGADDADDAWNREVRDETPLQREDRRWLELLQEVRVAQTGVQILLAFLLTVAFTERFASLDAGLERIYVATLLLGAGASALLIAPVSIHRLTFGQRLKPQLVRVANVLVVAGLTMLVLTIGSAFLLILDLVLGFTKAVWLTCIVMLWFAAWWYVLPLSMRVRHEPEAVPGGPGREPGLPGPTSQAGGSG
jgi:Family of unknown function (DUF6328)